MGNNAEDVTKKSKFRSSKALKKLIQLKGGPPQHTLLATTLAAIQLNGSGTRIISELILPDGPPVILTLFDPGEGVVNDGGLHTMRGDEVVHSTQPQVHRLLVGPLHQDVALMEIAMLKLQSLKVRSRGCSIHVLALTLQQVLFWFCLYS